MTKRFINTFIGSNGTTFEAYNTNVISDTDWAPGSNVVASIIYNNTLRRPNTQGTINQRVNFFNSGLTSGQTNNVNSYEVTVDFSLVGYTTVASNVGVIARGDESANNGYFVRYRPNTGYQLFRQTAGASNQLGTTNTTDLNPSGMSFGNPLRRRLRLSVIGSSINVYVDSYNNTTTVWTIGSTPLITTTDTSFSTGKFGLWFVSAATDTTTPTDGFIVNEYYINDLITTSNAPTLLTGTNQTGSTIDLSWTAPSNLGGAPLTNYIVEKTNIGDSIWASVGTPSTTSLTAAPLDPSGNDFRVRAITGTDNVGANSTILTVANSDIPSAVSSFTASSVTATTATLNWTAPVSGTVVNYKIEKSTLTGANNTLVNDWVQIAGSPLSSATLSASITLDTGVGNAFRITPVGSGGDGPSTTIKIARPDQVIGFGNSGVTLTSTNLSWTAATSNNASITYIVESTTISGSSWSAIAGSPFAVTSVTGTALSGSGNDFRVRATNIIGEGANSNTLSITPTTGTPEAPTSLAIRSFTPARTDSPLNLAYFTFTDTVNNKCHLQWSAPASSGTGGAITSYLIESSLNGSSGWTTVINTGNTNLVAYNITKPLGTVYFRVSAINPSGTGTPSNVLTVAGSTSTCEGTMVRQNGVWTFFTHPRAVCYRGNTYIGWVSNAGIVGVTKVNNITKEATHFDLEDVSTYVVQVGGAEIDDHDNAAIFIRQDGRITCYYGAHNDLGGIRSRTTVYPEDITQWSTAIADSPTNAISSPNVNLPTCYSNPRLLEDAGMLLYHFRTGSPPNAPHAVLFSNTLNTPNSTASYTDGLPLIQSTLAPWATQRPYVQSVVNGRNRVDFFFTDGHPGDPGTNGNGNGTSLYHFYVQWDKALGKARYYTSAGAEIVNPSATGAQSPSLPIRPKHSGGSDPTMVWNGVNIRSWGWDIVIGFDGHPRVLFTTYDNGSGSFGYTNQRYMFSRWNGTAWTTPVDITGATVVPAIQTTVRGVAVSAPGMGTSGVNGFTLEEPCYTGGCCFDANNPNIVYLVNTVVQNPTNNSALSTTDPTGIRELQEWRSNDNGLTWLKVRDITTNSLPNIVNGRPYSPKNHDGKVAVVWWRGPYSGWVRTFNTNLWCAPASESLTNPSDLAPLGARIAISRTGQLVPFAF
ncbi:BNR-4 repeat-containing protein [Nostoc sp. UIC 10607]|uniref:BNR-4 repeat-containing protein n=1 Tax=Nostoc sp. UIC 10607 TaxID=3045935 RepID=UPI0039A1246E